MRLQNDPQSKTKPHLCLEYNGKSIYVDEVGIADTIILATEEIAGHVKGILVVLMDLGVWTLVNDVFGGDELFDRR
ncbi:hypothetical protein FXO38_15571 [Capsicum annuum]|uniref:Uncharacterized protein n=1 Tax=Capsicum annuum TaxID=4072 RepID=A0A2G2YTC9_CAPAN|nr:hypothetical protein FXO38_15571 [Capsicum annuum]KAF3679835.1 hypothetical protein FXO37_03636 [Capsicum annuum]PHT72983.1 hypothetical protein T459_23768 [Capsicum annuum]